MAKTRKIDLSEELLTRKELAEVLKINPDKVYDLVARREIGFTKVGRELRFPKTEIEKYLSSNFIAAVEIYWWVF